MNSSLSSAANRLLVPVVGMLLLVSGCGPKDGVKEYADGMAAYELRNLEKAGKLFAKCLVYAPENVDALVMLARVQCDRGEIAEAGRTIERASALASDVPDVALLDAEIAFYAKDYKRAVARFSSVAENAKLGAEERSRGWTGLGIVEMTCDRRDFARIAFLRAIRLDNRNAAAHYHLGLLYRGDTFGYLNAARDEFKIFVRLGEKADSRALHAQRVIIPGIDDDIARRKAARPGASRRDSNAASAALERALAAWKKNDFKTARREYEAAYKADVLSAPAALGLAQAWAKTDASAAGLQKSLDYYKEACALNPGSIKTLLTAGDLAAKLGQHATAAELYSRAVAADPANITAIDGLIRALRKTGSQEAKDVANAYQRYRDAVTVRKAK